MVRWTMIVQSRSTLKRIPPRRSDLQLLWNRKWPSIWQPAASMAGSTHELFHYGESFKKGGTSLHWSFCCFNQPCSNLMLLIRYVHLDRPPANGVGPLQGQSRSQCSGKSGQGNPQFKPNLIHELTRWWAILFISVSAIYITVMHLTLECWDNATDT